MERDQSTDAITAPARTIVSYFDHEFLPLTDLRIQEDIAELKTGGFTDVIMTVSETDMRDETRQSRMRSMLEGLEEANINAWADPWRVGGVHGGEAMSFFENSGEKSCICNPVLIGSSAHGLIPFLRSGSIRFSGTNRK